MQHMCSKPASLVRSTLAMPCTSQPSCLPAGGCAEGQQPLKQHLCKFSPCVMAFLQEIAVNYVQSASRGTPAPVAAHSTAAFAARPGSPEPGPLMEARNDSVCWVCHAEVKGLFVWGNAAGLLGSKSEVMQHCL